jgi:Beta-ketoacyl synthase, N-terminal domain
VLSLRERALGKSLELDVLQWAAVVSKETAEDFGAAEPASVIPAAQRRRLPSFSRDVLRVALPLLRDQPRCPVVLSSPHGDLTSTVMLLSDIAKREVLSPSLFGLSVHNAPTGALSLMLEQPGDQISIAGEQVTLAAGLTEVYARLATQSAQSILLVHADERVPSVYADFEESDAPSVMLAMMLRRANGSSAPVSVGEGRASAASIVDALRAGQTRLQFSPPKPKAIAA